VKLTIGVQIDTEAEHPLILDSTCDGTEDEVKMCKVLTQALGDTLRDYLQAVLGKPIDDGVEEETRGTVQ